MCVTGEGYYDYNDYNDDNDGDDDDDYDGDDSYDDDDIYLVWNVCHRRRGPSKALGS
jgi:hypothetical protein